MCNVNWYSPQSCNDKRLRCVCGPPPKPHVNEREINYEEAYQNRKVGSIRLSRVCAQTPNARRMANHSLRDCQWYSNNEGGQNTTQTTTETFFQLSITNATPKWLGDMGHRFAWHVRGHNSLFYYVIRTQLYLIMLAETRVGISHDNSERSNSRIKWNEAPKTYDPLNTAS